MRTMCVRMFTNASTVSGWMWYLSIKQNHFIPSCISFFRSHSHPLFLSSPSFPLLHSSSAHWEEGNNKLFSVRFGLALKVMAFHQFAVVQAISFDWCCCCSSFFFVLSVCPFGWNVLSMALVVHCYHCRSCTKFIFIVIVLNVYIVYARVMAYLSSFR